MNVTVILVDRPADILPEGVYTIWKKSLILSSNSSSLKDEKENETLVNNTSWVCAIPTVKSLKTILSGLEMKAVPLNSRPATIYGFTIPSFCLTIALTMYSSSSTDSLGWY